MSPRGYEAQMKYRLYDRRTPGRFLGTMELEGHTGPMEIRGLVNQGLLEIQSEEAKKKLERIAEDQKKEEAAIQERSEETKRGRGRPKGSTKKAAK